MIFKHARMRSIRPEYFDQKQRKQNAVPPYFWLCCLLTDVSQIKSETVASTYASSIKSLNPSHEFIPNVSPLMKRSMHSLHKDASRTPAHDHIPEHYILKNHILAHSGQNLSNPTRNSIFPWDSLLFPTWHLPGTWQYANPTLFHYYYDYFIMVFPPTAVYCYKVHVPVRLEPNTF